MIDDYTLILRYKNGDMTGFDQLYNKYYRFLISYVSRKVSNFDDVEDIVQSVFSYFFKNYKLILRKGQSVYKTFVFFSLMFISRFYSTFNYIISDLQDVLVSNYKSSFDLLCIKELRKVLLDYINKLPKKQREVVFMFYFKQYTRKEISLVLGVSYSYSVKLVNLGLLNLKNLLSKEIENFT